MKVLKTYSRRKSLSEKMTFDRQVNEITNLFKMCDSERSRQLALQRLQAELDYEQLAIQKAMKQLGIKNDGTMICES